MSLRRNFHWHIALLGLLGGAPTSALGQPSVPAPPARPELPRPPPRPEATAPGGAPSAEVATKHLERVQRQATERRATRDARGRDERRELARTVRRWLRSGPMTAEARAELRAHANRTARLLRIQELAAAAGNADAVKRVDRLLSRESSRHDRWFRELGRPARAPSPAPADPARAE